MPGRLSMKNSNYRPCPECEFGRLEIAQLQKGCRCSYCHKLIETDFIYGAGVPVLLALLVGLSFNNDFGVIGYVMTAMLVFYTVTYDSIVARYLPLKHYGDSD
jgi:hypothetical protein